MGAEQRKSTGRSSRSGVRRGCVVEMCLSGEMSERERTEVARMFGHVRVVNFVSVGWWTLRLLPWWEGGKWRGVGCLAENWGVAETGNRRMGVGLRRSWLCRASVWMEQSLNELWISRTSVRKGDVVQRGVRRYRSAFG